MYCIKRINELSFLNLHKDKEFEKKPKKNKADGTFAEIYDKEIEKVEPRQKKRIQDA